MFKKLLTLTMGLGLALSAFAQWGNPRVSQDDILFWTGKGSNRAVIAITWNDAVAGNIGFAWGNIIKTMIIYVTRNFSLF